MFMFNGNLFRGTHSHARRDAEIPVSSCYSEYIALPMRYTHSIGVSCTVPFQRTRKQTAQFSYLQRQTQINTQQ